MIAHFALQVVMTFSSSVKDVQVATAWVCFSLPSVDCGIVYDLPSQIGAQIMSGSPLLLYCSSSEVIPFSFFFLGPIALRRIRLVFTPSCALCMCIQNRNEYRISPHCFNILNPGRSPKKFSGGEFGISGVGWFYVDCGRISMHFQAFTTGTDSLGGWTLKTLPKYSHGWIDLKIDCTQTIGQVCLQPIRPTSKRISHSASLCSLNSRLCGRAQQFNKYPISQECVHVVATQPAYTGYTIVGLFVSILSPRFISSQALLMILNPLPKVKESGAPRLQELNHSFRLFL